MHKGGIQSLRGKVSPTRQSQKLLMVLPGIKQGPQFLNSTWNDQFIT